MAKVDQTQLNLSKTTDANGWIVYNYGNWKKYAYSVSGSTGTIGASSGIALSSIALPVGMANLNNVNVQVSYYSTGQEVIFMNFSAPSATTLTIRAYNTYPSASLSPSYTLYIELTDK